MTNRREFLEQAVAAVGGIAAAQIVVPAPKVEAPVVSPPSSTTVFDLVLPRSVVTHSSLQTYWVRL